MKKFDIAIIGIGSRFPGYISSPEDLWQALVEGRDCITDIPSDRWSIEKYHDPDSSKVGKIRTKKGGFIKNMKSFDADFFKIYPRVAHKLDPRQRHILEVTYEAIEDAGLILNNISNTKTAVIIGSFLNDESKKISGSDLSYVSSHAVMGVVDTSVSARIAFQFNLKGPVMSVDTACSSSLVAVHLACNHIWLGDAEMAIAGGVSIMSSHEHTLQIDKGNFLSPDGYCKSFDASANGYTRSEGAGVVILKPLDQAKKDGDNIYAVIKNSVVNSDGYTADGMTVPCEFAQLDMLKKVYNDAKIKPKDVDFIEAHGTGTPVGDPKECWSFGNFFSKNRSNDDPLIVGSIKSNLGHTEAAAGVAGISKLALCIKNKQIPKNLHFNTPNPNIKFKEWKLKIADEAIKWPLKNNKKAIGGVNSFGAGGTNAHVILEEFIEDKKKTKKIDDRLHNFPYLFAISARKDKALKDLSEKYLDYIENSNHSLEDICFSSLTRRSLHDKKLIITTTSKKDLINALKDFIDDAENSNIIVNDTESRTKKKIAFIFSGQGAQWYGMGRQLFEKSDIFKQTIIKIDKIFKKIADHSLLDELLKNKDESRIGETRIDQPLITSIQIGLIEMFRSFGVEPKAVLGHSVGEVAAAYCAEVFDLEQAIKVIYFRSKEQDKASNIGKMLAIGLTYQQTLIVIEKYRNKVSVAASNSPNSTIISGDKDIIEEIAQNLEKENIFNRTLKMNIAFHSHHMELTKENLLKNLKDLKPNKAIIDIYSSVSGKKENGLHFNNEYCYKNVRNEVLFAKAIEQMLEDGYDCFIELSPHPILSSSIKETAQIKKFEDIEVISSLSRNIESFENNIIYEDKDFLTAISKLYCLDNKIKFDNLFNSSAKYVKLPLYSWQHKEYWSESKEHEDSRIGPPKYPFINFQIESLSQNYNKIWDLNLNKRYQTFLKDHRIDGEVVVPGTAQVEIAWEIAKNNFGDNFSHIENINFPKALFLPNEDSKIPQARFEIISRNGDYKIFSRQNIYDEWTNNGFGTISINSKNFQPFDTKLKNLQKKLITDKNIISPEEFYEKIKDLGLNYGSSFRLVKNMWQDGNEKIAKIELTDDHLFQIKNFNLMPNISDACLHIILKNPENGLYLPDVFGKFKIYNENKITKNLWSYTEITSSDEDYIYGKNISFNDDGEKILEVQNIKLKHLKNSHKIENNKDNGFYNFEWVEKPIGSVIPKIYEDNFILVFCDKKISQNLLEKFKKVGQKFIIINKGDYYERKDNIFTLNSNSDVDFDKLFSDLKNDNVNFNRIVNLWNVDYILAQSDDSKEFNIKSNELYSQNLSLIKEIGKIERELFIYQISKDADIVDPKVDKSLNIIQSSLYGMGRVFINEYPIHQLRMIDVGKISSNEVSKFLFDEIYRIEKDPFETEVAIRDYGRFARKLVKSEDQINQKTANLENAQLHYFSTNLKNQKYEFIQDLKSQNLETNLNAKNIVIRVSYYSLSEPSQLEEKRLKGFCGIIEKIGANIKDFKKGDIIIGVTNQSISGKIIIKEDQIIKKPNKYSDQDAAHLAESIYAINLIENNKIDQPAKFIDDFNLSKKIKQQITNQLEYKTINIADLKNIKIDNDTILDMSGKIEITQSNEIYFNSNVTYLITGGTSGLGLAICKWMFNKGARNFALISRSGIKNESDKQILTELEKKGANIEYKNIMADISDTLEIRKSLDYITKNMPTLKGIIHSAGILEDSSYSNMDMKKFLKVFKPKALGAWNLHQETKDLNLEIFLNISSVSSIIGIAGQSNYSTANNFLNYLSLYRGLNNNKSSSACFGVLSSEFAGMSKAVDNAEEMTYKTLGTIAIKENEAIDKLNYLLLSNYSYLMLSPMNWDNYRNYNSSSNRNFIFRDLFSAIKDEGEEKLSDLKDSIIQSSDSRKKASEILTNFLANILGIESQDISADKSIGNIGLDSLMINQFRNKIKSELGVNISLMKLAKGPNINEISQIICNELPKIDQKDQVIEAADTTGIKNDSDLEVSQDKWLIKKKSQVKLSKKMFCLHPVGAGASIFSHFLFNPPKDTEVITIQMPGRENRIDEDHYYDNMDNLIKDIASRIVSEIDCPVIFWGHSWGGVTLYEVAKYLRRNNYPQYKNIERLIITGSIAPQLTLLWKDRDSIKETANKSNSIDRILSTVSYIDDKDYLRNIIPIMRKDMDMIMTYKYVAEDKLDIPILAFGAIEDEVVLIEELKQWQEQTNREFSMHLVHGDHWFLSRNKDFILRKINEFINFK